MELELACRQRLAQIVLHGPALLHLRVHVGLEEAVGAAPVVLGAVERQVRIAHQLVGCEPVGRADGDADAGADDDLAALELVGLAHRLDDALRKRRGVGRLVDRHLQDRELVAAHARDRIGLAHQRAQAAGGILQQLVAGRVAQRVVDVLEVIEIEQMDGHHVAALDARQRLLELLVEQHAVGKAGERIVQRHVRDLRLRTAPFGDVHVGGDEAAVLERHAAHVQHRAVRALAHEHMAPGVRCTRAMRVATMLFDIAGAVLAAARVEAEYVLDRRRAAGEQSVRQVQQPPRLLVAEDHAEVAVEEGNAAREIVDDGLQSRRALAQQLLFCSSRA